MLMAVLNWKQNPVPKIATPKAFNSNFSILHGKLAHIAKKSSTVFFYKITLFWMKIWRWQSFPSFLECKWVPSVWEISMPNV